MIRYLKLGGTALFILVAGFLLGSGSIGDIIRSWIAGTGAGADQAEVSETKQELANEDVGNLGEALGTEQVRLTYNSAVRCIILSSILEKEDAYAVPITDDDLLTIEANARALAINRLEGQEGSASTKVSNDVNPITISHRSRFHGFSLGRLEVDPIEADPSLWDEEKRSRHDREIRSMIIELENTCSPLLGRASNLRGK